MAEEEDSATENPELYPVAVLTQEAREELERVPSQGEKHTDPRQPGEAHNFGGSRLGQTSIIASRFRQGAGLSVTHSSDDFFQHSPARNSAAVYLWTLRGSFRTRS
jgi:hypothetical protein